jgi:hypothetical protein
MRLRNPRGVICRMPSKPKRSCRISTGRRKQAFLSVVFLTKSCALRPKFCSVGAKGPALLDPNAITFLSFSALSASAFSCRHSARARASLSFGNDGVGIPPQAERHHRHYGHDESAYSPSSRPRGGSGIGHWRRWWRAPRPPPVRQLVSVS